jgi:hypothetical protein
MGGWIGETGLLADRTELPRRELLVELMRREFLEDQEIQVPVLIDIDPSDVFMVLRVVESGLCAKIYEAGPALHKHVSEQIATGVSIAGMLPAEEKVDVPVAIVVRPGGAPSILVQVVEPNFDSDVGEGGTARTDGVVSQQSLCLDGALNEKIGVAIVIIIGERSASRELVANISQNLGPALFEGLGGGPRGSC